MSCPWIFFKSIYIVESDESHWNSVQFQIYRILNLSLLLAIYIKGALIWISYLVAIFEPSEKNSFLCSVETDQTRGFMIIALPRDPYLLFYLIDWDSLMVSQLRHPLKSFAVILPWNTRLWMGSLTSTGTRLSVGCTAYTQRKLFGIALIQTEIRLYLPFSDWFGSKRKSVWIQINRKIVNTIWFRLELTRYRDVFSVCT